MPTYETKDKFVAANEKGLRVVFPEPDQLFVDIDDTPSMDILKRNAARMIGMGLIKEWSHAPSPSGAIDRFHVTVRLTRPVTDKFERIMLQALLGSDRIHEALSWRAALAGDDRQPYSSSASSRPHSLLPRQRRTRSYRFEQCFGAILHRLTIRRGPGDYPLLCSYAVAIVYLRCRARSPAEER